MEGASGCGLEVDEEVDDLVDDAKSVYGVNVVIGHEIHGVDRC